MGKVFGAILRLLVMLALFCLVGYNTWATAQMQVELDSLKRTVHAGTGKERAAGKPSLHAAAEGSSAEAGAGDPASLLLAAKRHAEAAQAHLERKEYAQASQEIGLAAEAARKASAEAGAASEDRLASLRRAINSVQSEADSLMKSHSAAGGSGAASDGGDR